MFDRIKPQPGFLRIIPVFGKPKAPANAAGNILIFTCGDKKTFFIKEDGQLTVNLTATDSGTMISKPMPPFSTTTIFSDTVSSFPFYAGKIMYIMTPYLILEETMIRSLIEAKSRGVDVRIITPSIPDKKHVKSHPSRSRNAR